MRTVEKVSDYDRQSLSFKRLKTVVKLTDKNGYLGYFEIWYDAEENDREYICLNHGTTYLDTLIELK